VVFLPSPFGRRAGDEGLRDELFSYVVFPERRVAFKDKTSIGVDDAVSPHPNPLPWEREIRIFFVVIEVAAI
jgi:hypothetical protein